MATPPLAQPTVFPSKTMSVVEYPVTVFRPDCDYVDGQVEERNLGQWDHSSAQTLLASYLVARRKQLGISVAVGQRVQVSTTRFRIPDVCVVLGEPDRQILRKPPFLCIEVLPPEDRVSRVRERVTDYLNMGVPQVWVVDPQNKSAFYVTKTEGWREVMDGVLSSADPAFEVPLAEIFA